jgi:hypothetical protein
VLLGYQCSNLRFLPCRRALRVQRHVPVKKACNLVIIHECTVAFAALFARRSAAGSAHGTHPDDRCRMGGGSVTKNVHCTAHLLVLLLCLDWVCRPLRGIDVDAKPVAWGGGGLRALLGP